MLASCFCISAGLYRGNLLLSNCTFCIQSLLFFSSASMVYKGCSVGRSKHIWAVNQETRNKISGCVCLSVCFFVRFVLSVLPVISVLLLLSVVLRFCGLVFWSFCGYVSCVVLPLFSFPFPSLSSSSKFLFSCSPSCVLSRVYSSSSPVCRLAS